MKKNNSKYNTYAIRKYTVGASSALIASFVFVGLSTSAHAEEVQPAATQPEASVQTEHTDKAVSQGESEPVLDSGFSHVQRTTQSEPPTASQQSEAAQTETSEHNDPLLDAEFSHVQREDAPQDNVHSSSAPKKEQDDANASSETVIDPEFSHVQRLHLPKAPSISEGDVSQEQSSETDSSKQGVNNTTENQKQLDEGFSVVRRDQQESQDVAQIAAAQVKEKDNTFNRPSTDELSPKVSPAPVDKTTKQQETAVTHVKPVSAPGTGETQSEPTPESSHIDKENPQATALRSTQQPAEQKQETLSKTTQQQSINKYPVIFVHGFMGFTGDVKPDLYPNYWGGDKYRIVDGLREKGYDAYEASVGAFSSNYDRAVELYYYIKGGTVDYGAAHAEKYGHARYGRTYTGVFHDWEPGKKVHMVGHSMGGQTIRLLEHFLRFGNQEEIDYQRQHGGTISPLFEGGKDNMIASITTLGTPHNGSAAADRIGNQKAFKDIVYALGRMGGGKLGNVDFGFEKWGFKQGENESYIDYANRVAKSNLWHTDDNAMYDLTSEGSEKLNQMTPMNPNIVYTTYTGLASHEGLTGNYVPDIGQFFLFDATSRVIGSEPDQSLRPNDGIVSVVSSLYPTGQAFTDFTDGLKKGIWQVTPVMKGWDHLDFVGLDTLDFKHTGQELQGFYAGLINNMMRVEELEA